MEEKLTDYLGGSYEIPGEAVKLGLPEETGENTGALQLILLNIGRETAAGIAGGNHGSGSRQVAHRLPPLQVNVYFVLAAVFEVKRYAYGLRLLSEAMTFFRQQSAFETNQGIRFIVEPVTLDVQQLTNVWSILGGRYYPSMVYKLRMLSFGGDTAGRTSVRIQKTE